MLERFVARSSLLDMLMGCLLGVCEHFGMAQGLARTDLRRYKCGEWTILLKSCYVFKLTVPFL